MHASIDQLHVTRNDMLSMVRFYANETGSFLFDKEQSI